MPKRKKSEIHKPTKKTRLTIEDFTPGMVMINKEDVEEEQVKELLMVLLNL